ncbi:MAG: helix-hairpin-helix domain-containing protein [Bacteroidetes bacterium]|nr:helix-hairpin-helix domain-containing protein [Bacteroidota bacterium]
MKRFQGIRDYLTFNRSELRGVIVLLVILLFVATANQLLPEGNIVPSVNFPGLENELRDFEAGIRRSEIEDSVKRAGKYRTAWLSADKIKDTVKGSRYPLKPVFRVDINKADTLEFQRLKGIGPSYARRIVIYRNRLGGFTNCGQLLEVWGMDSSLYNLIREQLIISSDSIRKLDINTVSFKELLRHPYFPYELTRSLILYRQKNKLFRSVDELNSVEGINDSVFRRIRPYVRVSR